MLDATVEVSGLRKRFGPTVALDGMTFTVQPGQQHVAELAPCASAKPAAGSARKAARSPSRPVRRRAPRGA
jgi:hypothetical protein